MQRNSLPIAVKGLSVAYQDSLRALGWSFDMRAISGCAGSKNVGHYHCPPHGLRHKNHGEVDGVVGVVL